jgi:nitrogen fixation-related uncharacterized protein
MNVMVLQVFVSLMLVLGSIVLFIFTVKSRTFEHTERLSLAPLEDDHLAPPPPPATPSSSPSPQPRESR